jgi:CheY-like chemotaxis protein
MNTDSHRPNRPPESFSKQVKDALEHLYDLSYLQHHPLVPNSPHAIEQPAELVGQRLRREMADAIEALNPGEGIPLHTTSARLYHLLVLHYMQGVTVRECAYDLGISERQAYRDLRQGEQYVAEVLWGQRSTSQQREADHSQLDSLQQEMTLLNGVSQTTTDVYLVLQNALEAVIPLATQRDVLYRASPPEEPVKLPTFPAVAEQLLISLLSHAVRQAQPGPLKTTLVEEDGQACLTVSYFPAADAPGIPVADQLTVQLADRLGWVVKQEDLPGGQRTITLRMAIHRSTVLVIDDNEGFAELIERYLAGCHCRVVAAPDGREGLRQAQDLAPDAILLDVMMPEMHGWQVLQRLHNHPRTANIPVIVCSVITLPELAQALGAARLLAKPVGQVDILDALRQLGVI